MLFFFATTEEPQIKDYIIWMKKHHFVGICFFPTTEEPQIKEYIIWIVSNFPRNAEDDLSCLKVEQMWDMSLSWIQVGWNHQLVQFLLTKLDKTFGNLPDFGTQNLFPT